MNDLNGLTCDFDLSCEELDIRYFDLIDYGELTEAEWNEMERCAAEDAAYAENLTDDELPF